MRFATLLLVLALMLILPVNTTPAMSGACTSLSTPNPAQRLALIAPTAHLILVGYVTDEFPVVVTPGPGGGLMPVPDASPSDHQGFFRSKVRVEAVLKGDDPGPELTLNFLSDEWQCVGGPRIFKGTRVLQMLHRNGYGFGPGAVPPYWQTGPSGSPTILTDDGAFLLDYEAFDYETGRRGRYVGTSDYVLKRIAREAEATEEATKQALAVIDAPTNSPLAGWIFVTIVLVGLSGLLIVLRVRGAR